MTPKGTTVAHRIHHIGYLTDDLDAAKRFYRQMFDAEITLESINPETGSKLAFLRFGEVEVELIEPADPARLAGRHGLVLDHVGYAVDDLDAAVADLSARGLAFASPAPRVSPEGSPLIQVAPDAALGTRLHLTERPGR